MRRSLIWFLVLSCGGQPDEEVLQERTGCDTLDESVCALPFPSSYFLTEDTNSVTGHRVNFGEQSLPKNRDDVQTRPDFWNEKDGFSVNSHMIAYFADLSPEGLIPWDDLGAHLSDTAATTVILDSVTGERISHFAEIDANVSEPTEAVLLLRPTVVLEHNRRYIIGIRGAKNVKWWLCSGLE